MPPLAALPELVPDRPVTLPPEALLLESPPHELLLLAFERQRAATPELRDLRPYQVDRSFEDLRWIARHAGVAVATEDPTVVRDLLGWLVALLEPRGLAASIVADGCRFLAEVLEPDTPLAAAVLRAEAALVAQSTIR